MVSGKQVASLLAFLIRMNGVRRILEIGTYTGYSALAMAENLPDDGELITLDVDAETNSLLRKVFGQKVPMAAKSIRSVKPGTGTAITGLKAEFRS